MLIWEYVKDACVVPGRPRGSRRMTGTLDRAGPPGDQPDRPGRTDRTGQAAQAGQEGRAGRGSDGGDKAADPPPAGELELAGRRLPPAAFPVVVFVVWRIIHAAVVVVS